MPTPPPETGVLRAKTRRKEIETRSFEVATGVRVCQRRRTHTDFGENGTPPKQRRRFLSGIARQCRVVDTKHHRNTLFRKAFKKNVVATEFGCNDA